MARADIKILNFSNSDQVRNADFRFKNIPFCSFVVEVHPRGIRNKEYVSVRIFKKPKNATAWSCVNNVRLSWTLSVVDLNGDARCSQSFVIENAAQFTNEDVLDFQKRSHLLSRADELLPEDVLTIRCELHEIFIGADELLVPETKEERLKRLGISNMDTTRKRGKARIFLEIHKIYSSITNISIKLSTLNFMDEYRQEEIRNALASYDALDEIRETYLGSYFAFRTHLDLKEQLRKAINDGKKCFIDNSLSVIPLEVNRDGGRRRISQMTPEPPKDEGQRVFETVRHEDGKSGRTTETDQRFNIEELETAMKDCFVDISKQFPRSIDYMFGKTTANTAYGEKERKTETVRQDCSLSQKDGEGERTTETDQRFNIEKFNTAMKRNFANILKLLPHLMDNFFDKIESNIAYGEKERKTETVRQDCSLSQKDGERERATENVQPLDFDIFSIRDKVKKNIKDDIGIIQHIIEENFDAIHEIACGEQECKREATTVVNSGPSQGQFEFLPGTVGQEGSSNRRDGESERTETHRPSDLETSTAFNGFMKFVMKSAEQHFTKLEEPTRGPASETQYDKTKVERKNTAQIGSPLSKNEDADLAKLEEVCKELINFVRAKNTHLLSRISLISQYGSTEIGNNFYPTMDTLLEVVEKVNEKYIKRMEKLLLNYNGNKEHDSIAENQATWNLYLETMDGITFTIPFEDGRETLGSKLVSHSKVFQEMLELNPERQTPEEKVKLKDEDCDTFINFLSFLQTEDIEVETFPELISLYNLADKYDVQELMLLCAERMQPLFSPSNIDEVEEFACIHYDEHLLELVQLYKDKNIQPVLELNEDTETLLNENSASWDAQTKEQDWDFGYYS